jgi:Protein of unknown function (DUF3486)
MAEDKQPRMRQSPPALPNPNVPRPSHSPFDPGAIDQRWKIRALPPELRDQLEQRLSTGAFKSYSTLSEWLLQNGFKISRTALFRYGRTFDRKLHAVRVATQQAKIVCEQFKDDDASVQDALLRLVQTQLFQVLVASHEKQPVKTLREQERRAFLEDEGERVEPINIHALARSVAALARAETEFRKRTERAREKIEAAKKKVDDARSNGLPAESADQIKDVLMKVWE